jgi:hypothetical protein
MEPGYNEIQSLAENVSVQRSFNLTSITCVEGNFAATGKKILSFAAPL